MRSFISILVDFASSEAMQKVELETVSFLHFLTANKNCKSHFNSIYWHPNVLTHARIKYSGKIIIQKIYKAQVGFSRPFDIFKLLSVCGSRLFLRTIMFLHPFGALKMISNPTPGHSFAQCCLSLFIAPDCHCSRKSVDQVLLNSSLSRSNFTGDKCFSQENFVYMLTPSGSLGPSA